MSRTRRTAVVISAVLVAAALQVAAAGAALPVDGIVHTGAHSYELVETLYVDWNDANAAATAMSNGKGRCAHLATITSAEEQAILTALMEGKEHNAWLGGYQPPGELSLDQGWQWITGEPWSFTNWAEGEPNDTPYGTYSAGSEQYLEAYQGSGLWNDAPTPDEAGAKYFVVEYEQCHVEIVVEEALPVVIPDPGQAFDASGPAVGSGVVCPAGVVADTAIAVSPGLGHTKLEVTKLFTCDDGTGTFEVDMKVKLYPSSDSTAQWKVIIGTGDYTTLQGNGSLVGTAFPGGITDVYSGMMKR